MTNSQEQNIKTNSTINRTEKLQSSLQDTCLCQNKKSELVTTVEESEIVCRNCGVVFGFDGDDNSNTIPYQHITKSKINLYQKRQKGGNPHDVKKITRIPNLRLEKNNDNDDLISFADICDKLELSDITSETCWKSYCTLKRQTSKFTRAKAVCLAVYQTCRSHHIPFDESKIRDIVCQSLGVKNAPMLKNIIFKACLDQKSNLRQSNSEKERFYLNLHLSQAQKFHNIEDITILRRIATRYHENLTSPSSSCFYNDGLSPVMKSTDYNTLAKRAVKLAVQRCMK